MTRSGSVLLAILLSAASLLYGQVDKIVIPAGITILSTCP